MGNDYCINMCHEFSLDNKASGLSQMFPYQEKDCKAGEYRLSHGVVDGNLVPEAAMLRLRTTPAKYPKKILKDTVCFAKSAWMSGK